MSHHKKHLVPNEMTSLVEPLDRDTSDDEIIIYAHNQPSSLTPTASSHVNINSLSETVSEGTEVRLSLESSFSQAVKLSGAFLNSENFAGSLLNAPSQGCNSSLSFRFSKQEDSTRAVTVQHNDRLKSPLSPHLNSDGGSTDSISDMPDDPGVPIDLGTTSTVRITRHDLMEENEYMVDEFAENVATLKSQQLMPATSLLALDPIASDPCHMSSKAREEISCATPVSRDNENWIEAILEGNRPSVPPTPFRNIERGKVNRLSVRTVAQQYENQQTWCQKLNFLESNLDGLLILALTEIFDKGDMCIHVDSSKEVPCIYLCTRDNIQRDTLKHSLLWHMQNGCRGTSDGNFRIRMMVLTQKDTCLTGIVAVRDVHRRQGNVPCIVECAVSRICLPAGEVFEEFSFVSLQGPMIILPSPSAPDSTRSMVARPCIVHAEKDGCLPMNDDLYSTLNNMDFLDRLIRIFALETCPWGTGADRLRTKESEEAFHVDHVTQWGFS